MSETTTPPTPAPAPTASGKDTSEYRLTRAVVLIGAILQGASVALLTLQGSEWNRPWIALALAGIAGLSQTVAILGYQWSRTNLKAQAALPPAVAPTTSTGAERTW